MRESSDYHGVLAAPSRRHVLAESLIDVDIQIADLQVARSRLDRELSDCRVMRRALRRSLAELLRAEIARG